MGEKSRNLKLLSRQDKHILENLELFKEKCKVLFENVSSGVAVYEARDNGEDFVFVDFNPSAEAVDKIKKEELIGKSVVEIFPGVKEFGLFEVFQRVWRTGIPEHHPVSVYKDNRVAGWRENHVFKLPSGEIMAIYDDVTKEKHSELAARMSEQCFKAIADYTYGWEVWVSPKGRVLWTNAAVHRVTGYTPKELVAMPDYPDPLVYEEDRDRIARANRSALRESTGNNVQFRLLRKDGSVIWAEMSWQPIYDNNDHSLGYRGSIRDIQTRKEAEEALRKSEEKYRKLAEKQGD